VITNALPAMSAHLNAELHLLITELSFRASRGREGRREWECHAPVAANRWAIEMPHPGVRRGARRREGT
jgi:hypothetical protein